MYAVIDGTNYPCRVYAVSKGVVRVELDEPAPMDAQVLAVYDDEGVLMGEHSAEDYAHVATSGSVLVFSQDEVSMEASVASEETPASGQAQAPTAQDLIQLRADVDFLLALEGVS